MALPDPLQQLFDLDKSSPRFHDRLHEIIGGKEYRERVPHLRDDDLARLVEYLDSVLDCPDGMAHVFRMPLHELRRICGAHETLPKSSTIPHSLQIGPSADPGYAQAGTLNGAKVRVKCVRIYPNEHPRTAKKAFNQLAVVWKRLSHPNVVPLLGVTIDPLQLVSEWMPCVDLVRYIENHPDSDRLGLLYDVAEGLNYLHSCNVIHGGLKGPNILVNINGRALITDFGLALVTQSLDSVWSATDERAHTIRWVAPEILGGWGTYSKEGDVFSLAMVTIEIFTGAVPFVDSLPAEALLSILKGERPPRPTDRTFKDGLWALTQRCWNQEAHLRPRVSEVLQDLCGFGIPAWRRLFSRPRTTDERIPLVTEIFSDSDEIQMVKCLREGDAQIFIDVIDEALHSLPQLQQKECLRALRRICGRQGLLPRSLQISFSYDRSDVAPCGGGFADVWMGDHQGRKVAVKVPRVHTMKNREKVARRFCKEAVMWKTLRHQNVLSLLGATVANSQFAMVSEWMSNGKINEFTRAHRDVNRFELLKDVARGLIYMHGQGMIHGDLKGANILIDNDCHARLADFGLLTIVSDPLDPTASSLSAGGGTTRWMGPELLYPEQFGLQDSQPTKESDCYAFGMVIYEVLSSQAPFASSANAVVIRKVLDGERPERPQGEESVWFVDDLWKMTELCWAARPESRPSIESVLECLGRVPWPPPSTDDKSSSTTSSSSGRSIIKDGNQSSVLSHNYPSDVTNPPKSHGGEDMSDDEDDTDYEDDEEDVTISPSRPPRPSMPNDDNGDTREAGHSSRYHPPATSATTNAPSFHSDRTNYADFSPRRQTDGVLFLRAALRPDNTSSPIIQQRQGQGQFQTPGWAREHTPQPPGPAPGQSTMPSLHLNGAGSPSLRVFGQHPLVEPRSPTPGDMPVVGWVPNPTLSHPSQYLPNGHGNGSGGGSNGAAFFRTYQEYDRPTTPRHHVMTPELNFAVIGHGRGTSHGTDVPREYGGDETRDKDPDDEDLIVVDAGDHTPLTPPSGYGSTNVITPTPRRGYSVGDISQSDGSGTDERQAHWQNPYRHQMERGGRGRSEKKGWRNRLTAAEQYASSILFGRGGSGAGGSGSGAGSSSQVLHERDH